ncbi:peroxiredoxin-like family protein [Bosea sp. BH3]|uniref:peroxiredoxin-like family protein n=1 Tax=Bosea sp. BH3 TaxID=2871701 RepID=UPI0021CB222A|nr:peroxiredoxin-like family protein [Bosea sp. BH3]
MSSLNEKFRQLEAERETSWSPEALRINREQRQRLVAELGDRGRVQVGDAIGQAALIDVTDGAVALDRLHADGPLVLIFFRFAGCPACNIALPHYDRELAPGVRARGARLVAVSPQVPERLVEIRERHGLSFAVASDPGNALAARLGVTYEYDGASRAAATAAGRPIGDVTGTGTWELPMPSVLVIDREGIVRFAEISPGWMDRTEAGAILSALDALASRARQVA